MARDTLPRRGFRARLNPACPRRWTCSTCRPFDEVFNVFRVASRVLYEWSALTTDTLSTVIGFFSAKGGGGEMAGIQKSRNARAYKCVYGRVRWVEHRGCTNAGKVQDMAG